MRILFLISGLGVGGAERQLVLLAKGLVARGHEVEVVLSRPGGPFEADLAGSGVVLRKPERRGRLGPLSHAVFVHRAMRAFRPQIVHGYLPVGNLMALIGRLARPRPRIVWGLRASDMDVRRYGPATRLAHWLEVSLSRLADLAITNSAAGAEVARARGFRTKRIEVVPNGISLDEFHPDAERRARTRDALGIAGFAVVGHAARLDPMKDHATFLRALVHLFARRADLFALLVAPGDEARRRELENLAARLGLTARIKVLAETGDMLDIYNALDALCLSSAYGEGFPNVVVEAMACGVPCAVTRVGDAARVVGSSGASAPPGAPTALADAIAHVLDRYLPRDEGKVRAVRDSVRRFSAEQLAARTDETLRALLDASPAENAEPPRRSAG